MNRRWHPITLLLLCCVVAILVVNWAVNRRSLRDIDANTETVTRTQQVLLTLNTILSLAKDAETGQRGFLLTGREEYLEPYQGSQAEILRKLDELRELTAGDPEAQQRIPAIREKIDERFAILEQGIQARRQNGLAAASEIVASGRGKAAMDSLRKEIADFVQVESDLLRMQADNAARSFQIIDTTGLVLFGLGLASIAGFAYQQDRMLRWRERSAAALLQERELLRVTLRSIGDGVIAADTQGKITFLNRVAESLTGWTSAAAKGQPIEAVFAIVDEQTEQPVENPVRRVLGEGSRLDVTHGTILIAKDGARRPIDDSGAPVRSGESILGAVLVFRDIGQQIATERQIRESADRFRQLADAMPQIVWVARPDGTVEYFNQKWYDYTGAESEECLNRRENLWIHPDDRDHSQEAWERSIATGDRFEIERRIRSRTGEYRWFLGRALPVRDPDGTIHRWFGTSTDIEDYKRSQAERHKFFSLVENSTDFIAMTDLAGVPFYVNRAGLSMTGLDQFSAIEQRTILDFFFPEDREKIAAEFIPRVLKHGFDAGEIRFQHFQTGQAFWMTYNTFCLFDDAHRLMGLATVGRDITERKALEDQLRVAAADLSEANRRKTEFLATLAHELRNPMAPIRTGLELIRLANGDQQVIEETRSMMERQARQMVRLIDDLLDVSRITQGKLRLRKARIELADVIRSSVEAIKPLIDEAGHALDVSLPDRPVYLDADPNRLAQVFSNLLSNAAKYTKDGGYIRLSAEAEDGQAVVHVADSGIGIPAELQDDIFEMFAQIDRPLEKGYTGLGIGLTLVKRLVELHEGKVEVHSEGANQGTEFTVRLPLAAEQSRGQDSAESSLTASPKTKPFQILVVDDNKAAAEMLRMMLKVMGHDVRMAHDGQEGFELAERYRPDVMLMDLGMPRLNGYEAAHKIRETEWGQRIWLIALTGWGQDEDKQRTRAAGFDHHLTKPAEPAALQALLSKLERRP